MNLNFAFRLAGLSLLLTGCGTSSLFGLSVNTPRVTTHAPSEVNLLVSVSDGKTPVIGLSASNFKIFENGLLLDNKEIDLQILSKESVAASLTVLLLDVSGKPSDIELKRMERGASHFVEKVSVTQPVTVVAFDGSERPREVARFARVDRATQRPLPPLNAFLSTDTSRNLNGSMLSVIKGVQAELKRSQKEEQLGTIVTLVRGPDLAGRTKSREVLDAVYDSGFDFYSLSPEGASVDNLSEIGKRAQMQYPTVDTMPIRFTDLGMLVRSIWYGRYLLSYCSPARAGERKLKVSIKFEAGDGHDKKGSLNTRFDASAFTGGCRAPVKPTPALSTAAAPLAQVSQGKTNQPAQATTQTNPTKGESEEIVAPPDSGKYE